MSVEHGDGETPSTVGGDGPRSVRDVLVAVVRRLRATPRLAVPFVLAGAVVGLADWLRLQDPLPAGQPPWMGDVLSVQYALFPAGTARTTRELGAFPDLRLPYLLGGIALEALVVLSVGVAGWLTLTRALSADRTALSFGRYVGGFVAVAALLALVPAGSIEIRSLPLALLALAVAFVLVVRLFLVPGLLASGSGVVAALRESGRRSRGVRVTVGWLAVTFGVASWGLATVPVVGGFLSTAVVGTVQAVAIAVLLGRPEETTAGPERL